MEKEININEWLDNTGEVTSTLKFIKLEEFKNFNQIKRGLNIIAPKANLMTNPVGYQNFFNDVEKVAAKDNIKLTFTEQGENFILTFK